MKHCISSSFGQGSKRQMGIDSSAFRPNKSNPKF